MVSTEALLPAPRAIGAELRARTDVRAGTRTLRLALAGGGTGGHIVPGLHLLSWLALHAAAAEHAGPADVLWFTSGRAVEDRVLGGAHDLLARTPYERVALTVEPRSGGAPSRARLVLRTPAAVMHARERLVAHRSEVLVGLGGFTSLPAVLAARSLRIPIVLIEINAHSGAATRWLRPFAVRVLHAWRSTLPHGETATDRFAGPPLAPVFHEHALLDDREREDESARARVRLGFDAHRPLLVVLGGSQGSSALNKFVREHAKALLAGGVQVLHQTGPRKLSEAAAACAGYRALEYVDPVHDALRAATIALVRGGASTLAEIAAMRVPAFVAPYPGHADEHQTLNARELGEGVRIVPDHRLDAETRDALLQLAGDAGVAQRASMSAALARAVPVDAAAAIWEQIVQVAGRNETRTSAQNSASLAQNPR